MHGSGLLRMDDFKRMKSMERSMQLCQLTLYASKQTKLSPLLLCKRVQPFRICWPCMYIKWHAYVRRSFSCHAWYVKQLLRNDFAGQHWNPFGYGSQCQPCSWWDWRWWKRYWRWTTQISGYPVTCEHPKFQHFNMHGITWIQLIYKDISLKIGSMHGSFFMFTLCECAEELSKERTPRTGSIPNTVSDPVSVPTTGAPLVAAREEDWRSPTFQGPCNEVCLHDVLVYCEPMHVWRRS